MIGFFIKDLMMNLVSSLVTTLFLPLKAESKTLSKNRE
jgi:hypothetical protein